MDTTEIFLIVCIIAACSIWYWFSKRKARKLARDEAALATQRKALGIGPGVGQNRALNPFRPATGKRCRRGVCTTPGASCPLECVEEPQVMTLIDGSQVHEYENMEVQYGPTGSVWSLKVDGKTWI